MCHASWCDGAAQGAPRGGALSPCRCGSPDTSGRAARCATGGSHCGKATPPPEAPGGRPHPTPSPAYCGVGQQSGTGWKALAGSIAWGVQGSVGCSVLFVDLFVVLFVYFPGWSEGTSEDTRSRLAAQPRIGAG